MFQNEFLQLFSTSNQCHAKIVIPNLDNTQLCHEFHFPEGSIIIQANKSKHLDYKINSSGEFVCITNNFHQEDSWYYVSKTQFSGLRIYVKLSANVIHDSLQKKRLEHKAKQVQKQRRDTTVSLGYVKTNQRTKANYSHTNIKSPYRGGSFAKK